MRTTTSTLYRNDQLETMRAICPYCGHDNVPAIDLDARHATILCEEETGGCDRYFWIRIQRWARVESYAIEAQHPEISPTTLTMVNSQPAGLSDRVNMNGTGHHSPVTEVTQPPQADTTPAQPWNSSATPPRTPRPGQPSSRPRSKYSTTSSPSRNYSKWRHEMDTRPISAMTFVAATLIFALLLWLVHIRFGL